MKREEAVGKALDESLKRKQEEELYKPFLIEINLSPKEENKLTVDSKEPEFSNYDVVFEHELRYKNLEVKNESEYQRLYEENINHAKERYNYFKNLEKKDE